MNECPARSAPRPEEGPRRPWPCHPVASTFVDYQDSGPRLACIDVDLEARQIHTPARNL